MDATVKQNIDRTAVEQCSEVGPIFKTINQEYGMKKHEEYSMRDVDDVQDGEDTKLAAILK